MPYHRRPSGRLFLLSLFALLMAYVSLYAVPNSEAQGTIPVEPAKIYLPLINNDVPTATATSINTPSPTPTNTPVPSIATPTLVPGVVSIKNSNALYRDGLLYVFGEIYNGTSDPIFGTIVKFRFFDEHNKLLYATSTEVSLLLTAPGQVSPFSAGGTKSEFQFDRYVVSGTYTPGPDFGYRYLTVISQQIRDNNGVEVFGKVRNNDQKTVSPPRVVVTFYDSDGSVIDVDSVLNDAKLGKGKTADYSIKTLRAIDYATYAVQSQSYVLP